MSTEPEIIINATPLGSGCSTTIRVAIEIFYRDLIENGLGEDEHGKRMVKAYLERINEIRKCMGLLEEENER